MKHKRTILAPALARAIRLFAAQDGQSVAEYAVAMAAVLFVSLAGLTAIEGQSLEAFRRLFGLH